MTTAEKTPQQIAAAAHMKTTAMLRTRSFRVGDHVDIARRVVERVGHIEECDHLICRDGAVLARWKEGEHDAEDEGWKQDDLIACAAEYSGSAIVDVDGDQIGVVRLTYADLCGIAKLCGVLCLDWFPKEPK